MIEITKEILENHVPSFRNATPYIFESLSSYVVEARDYVYNLCSPEYAEQETFNLRVLATRLICLRTARRAVPGLDLILTENGFGIVSNQNVSPASSARVEALRVSLRQQESQAEDLLIFALLKTDWKKTAVAVSRIESLLWNPTLLRRYGVTLDGREAYAEEFGKLQPRIEQAEEMVRGIIGPELHAALVERERTMPEDSRSEYAIVREFSRKLMSVVISKPTPQFIMKSRERLIDTLNRYADSLPEYRESSTYRSYHFDNFKNRDEDHTYFFS
ncbi:MAG: hypothetical protein IKR91_06290 [Alloprevotella sp.]|nr:hypothetical protein [Alloprevotella sp.]